MTTTTADILRKELESAIAATLQDIRAGLHLLREAFELTIEAAHGEAIYEDRLRTKAAQR